MKRAIKKISCTLFIVWGKFTVANFGVLTAGLM